MTDAAVPFSGSSRHSAHYDFHTKYLHGRGGCSIQWNALSLGALFRSVDHPVTQHTLTFTLNICMAQVAVPFSGRSRHSARFEFHIEYLHDRGGCSIQWNVPSLGAISPLDWMSACPKRFHSLKCLVTRIIISFRWNI